MCQGTDPQSQNTGRIFEPKEIFRVKVSSDNYPKSGIKSNQFEHKMEMYCGYECSNSLIPESQICQNCLQQFDAEIQVCPGCGYDIFKDLEAKEQELELKELTQKGFASYLHAINILAWEIQKQNSALIPR